MEPVVALAVLAASLLHASWHALVKSSGDRLVALAGMNGVSGLAALAAVPYLPSPPLPVFGVIAASVVLHVTYKIALAKLYARADLSLAYPLGRGLTPLAALALAFIALGERPSLWTAVGVLAICAGAVGLVVHAGAPRLALRTLVAAVVTGAAVAAYTLLDAYGARLNGDWLGFTAWLVLCDSATFISYAVLSRGAAIRAAWTTEVARTLASGALGLVSFSVLIWALSRAQVGAVAALRESSIMFSALIGAFFLRERVTLQRAGAVALVMAGAAAVAAAR